MGRSIAILQVSIVVKPADWPQWRRPNRDGVSTETGRLGGWRTSSLSEGYPSIAIVNGRIYRQPQRGNQEYALAFDVKTGTKLWESPATRACGNDRGNHTISRRSE